LLTGRRTWVHVGRLRVLGGFLEDLSFEDDRHGPDLMSSRDNNSREKSGAERDPDQPAEDIHRTA
jgi:hypothetical protein